MNSMLVPGLSELPEPEIVQVADFEAQLQEFKTLALEYVQARDPAQAQRLAVALENDSELLAMLLQVMTLRLQNHERKYNTRIKQMLAWWATGSNLDVRLADMGLERRVITPGNPNAFPPVPAVLETEEEARLRYYLAPHAPAAGSRLHYCREALTLGERASITVEATEPGVVVTTYRFAADSVVAEVKDAAARRTAAGVVTVAVLGRAGDGTPSTALLAAQAAHFARTDVRPETDDVVVEAAEIIPYTIRATIYIRPGRDTALSRAAALKRLEAYAQAQHRLGGYVDPSRIDHELHAAGAERLALAEPVASVECEWNQAPYCAAIELEALTL